MDHIEHKKGKIYYSMGEVAEMFDVSQTLIRFWESKFDILKPHRNKKGNRMFTPADVDNVKLIYHLVKEKGMTLAGAQKRIKDNPEGISRDMEITDRLQRIRALLLEIREELKTDGGEVYRDELDAEEAAPAAPKTSRKRDKPEVAVTERPAGADELIELQAEEEWVAEELSELNELDGNIGELSAQGGVSQAEADDLLENDVELPENADSGADAEQAPWVSDGISDGVITEQEMAMLDGGPEPDYPENDLDGDLFAGPGSGGGDTSLFGKADGKAAEEPQKPRIVEQTLF